MGSRITNIIETPLGAVLILVITLVLAGLTVASAISGQLTAAAIRVKGKPFNLGIVQQVYL